MGAGRYVFYSNSIVDRRRHRMEKRVLFKSTWLPWLLIAPQMAVILVFFFWPAGPGAVPERAAAGRVWRHHRVCGAGQLPAALFKDPSYLASFKTTAMFSLLVAVSGLSIALLLAVMANRVVRGAAIYKTLLIWPYAVAPVVAGVLWLMMFASPYGVIPTACARWALNGTMCSTATMPWR
jgi:sn-glycerol 3-phosphate transport system permease protein